jgi:hypothetical protein
MDEDDYVDINTAWESIRENMKPSAMESTGYYKLKQHKPWFDEEYSKLLDQRKQAKLQWLQNLSQTNGDILNNVGSETGRNFRYKKSKYVKQKMNGLKTDSKNKNIRDLYRGTNKFKEGYQTKQATVLGAGWSTCRFPQYFEWVEELLQSAIECIWC